MKTLPFFADENSFNYRNIVKTKDDFSNLSAENVSHGRSKGILLATRFGLTDILVLLLTLLFGVKLLSAEREGGFLPLLRSTVNGKRKLAAAKLSALAVTAFTAASMLYGSSILTGAAMYGFGDTSRAFGSVSGFFSCGLQISVSDFFVLFFLIKLLFCAALSAMVFVIFSLPFVSAACFAIIGGFTAAETALYFLIPSTSIFSVLRQVNIVAVANTGELIGKYLNINLFGYSVSSVPITIAAVFCFSVVCAVGGIFCFAFSDEKSKSAGRGLLRGSHTKIVLHEFYKSFFCGKAILLLPVSVAALLVLQKPIKVHYSDITEYYYYSYISEISGEFTEEKSAYIDSELEKALSENSDESKYKAEALGKLREHADYLRESGGYFVADKGYKMLTGGDEARIYDRLMAALKTSLLLLLVSFSYYIEYRFGGDMLLRSSLKGRTHTFLAKMLCAAVMSLSVLLIFDGIRIYSVLNAYGIENIFAPACSIEYLENFKMPIACYLILTELERLVGMILVSALVFIITKLTKSYSLTVILSAVIFAIPPILSVMGFEFMDYFLLSPLLVGNVFV